MTEVEPPANLLANVIRQFHRPHRICAIVPARLRRREVAVKCTISVHSQSGSSGISFRMAVIRQDKSRLQETF